VTYHATRHGGVTPICGATQHHYASYSAESDGGEMPLFGVAAIVVDGTAAADLRADETSPIRHPSPR